MVQTRGILQCIWRVAMEFQFTVPQCSKGTTLQVTAPDGVMLNLPLPEQADPGDEIYLIKRDNGQWGLKHIAKVSNASATAIPPTVSRPAVPQAAANDLDKRSRARLAQDLAGPDAVNVKFETTKGAILMKVAPAWSPNGAERFLQLVDDGYYTDIAIYRGITNFLVQFGIVKDPERNGKYGKIADDPLVGVPYLDGMVGFAAAGPNTRTSTLCYFLGDIPYLGKSSVETPFGMICPGQSMNVLHELHNPGDIPQCGGSGPDPDKLGALGNEYIAEHFPDCDYILAAFRC